jgi:hypothetical protein
MTTVRGPPAATHGSPIAAPRSLNRYFKEEADVYVVLDGARLHRCVSARHAR